MVDSVCLGFETKCLRELLRISYTERTTNDLAQSLSSWDTRKPRNRETAQVVHVALHDILSIIVLHSTMEDRRGGQRKSWMASVKEWTGRSMQQDRSRLIRVTSLVGAASSQVPQTTGTGRPVYLVIAPVKGSMMR